MNEPDYKKRCIERFDEGYQEWDKFCELMKKYPHASYAELLCMLEAIL